MDFVRTVLLPLVLAVAVAGAGCVSAPVPLESVDGPDYASTAAHAPVADVGDYIQFGVVILFAPVIYTMAFLADAFLLPLHAATNEKAYFFPCCRAVNELYGDMIPK